MPKFTPPSGRQHPPGKKVGGQHSGGAETNHGGGYGAGGNSGNTGGGVTRPPHGIKTK